MGYLAYIIAFFTVRGENTHGMSSNQLIDRFLDVSEHLNRTFIGLSFIPWIIILVGAFIFFRNRSFDGLVKAGIGCFALFFLIPVFFLPLSQLCVWWLNSVMAHNFDQTGPTNLLKFGLAFFITIYASVG